MITLVATAHNEEVHNRVFVDSILNQIDPDWKAIIFHNGTNPEFKDYVESREDKRLIYRESKEDTGKWGTDNRQITIEECDTDYIIQTSVQDYWLSQAIKYINEALTEEPSICIWDSINHLVGPCKILESELVWSKLDWGNFAIRASIAKRVGILHGGEFCADWLFVKDCIESGYMKKATKIPRVLTIHN